MAEVTFHQRYPDTGYFSIERLFDSLVPFFSEDIRIKRHVSPFLSQGVARRVANLASSATRSGDVHHIVGDVYYLANVLPPRKLVLTYHDCAALERLSGLKNRILLNYWFLRPFQRAAYVSTVSEATRVQLRRWIGSLADKAVVIPNCVGTEFCFSPKAWPGETVTVLQVGTAWNKNVVRVAESLVGLPCKLEIVGDLSPSQRERLMQLGIRFKELGRLSDAEVLASYQRCDLLVFASIYEGFGMPILEAQATGRPVITSNRYSMPEAAGGAALLVNPEDTQSIHEAVRSILSDPRLRERLVGDGLKNAARFHPRVIAAQYESLYRKCLANGRSTR
jgi:glycosyltransferase involved in cell wall biosynthesis